MQKPRHTFLKTLLLAGTIMVMPATFEAAAQDNTDLARKVEILERQLRAVQRRVFRGGDLPDDPSPQPVQTGPVADSGAALITRLSAIEKEMRNLTGRLEEMEYRQRQLEDRINDMERGQTAQRPGNPGNGRFGPQASNPNSGFPAETGSNDSPLPSRTLPEPQVEAVPAEPVIALPDGSDKAKFDYAFGFVRSNDNASAEKALKLYIEQGEDDSLKTNARYWLGKVHAIENQPGRAAEQFLFIFQNAPQHDKAPVSLVELASALVKLDKKSDACDVLGEFDRAYEGANDRVKRQANAVRLRANCG